MSNLNYVNLTCMNNNINNTCNYIKPDKYSKFFGINSKTDKNFTINESIELFNRYKRVCHFNNGEIELCCPTETDNYTEEEILYFNQLKKII